MVNLATIRQRAATMRRKTDKDKKNLDFEEISFVFVPFFASHF